MISQQSNSWLISFGAAPIPEVWHSEKNGGFIKKEKQKVSVRLGKKRVELSNEQKQKLLNDVHNVIKLGIIDPATIYDRLLVEDKLTQSDGRIIPLFSFCRYVYIARNELNIKIKSKTQKIVELFKNGVTDRSELAEKVGCTEDHVSKVLRENGLKKRVYKKTKG